MLVFDPLVPIFIAFNLGIICLAAWRIGRTNSVTTRIGRDHSDSELRQHVISYPLAETYSAIIYPIFTIAMLVAISMINTPVHELFQIEQGLIGTPDYILGTFGVLILSCPIQLLAAFRLTGIFIVVSKRDIEVHVIEKTRLSIEWNSVKKIAKWPQAAGIVEHIRIELLSENGMWIGTKPNTRASFISESQAVITINTRMKGMERFYEFAEENLPTELRDSPTFKWMLSRTVH